MAAYPNKTVVMPVMSPLLIRWTLSFIEIRNKMFYAFKCCFIVVCIVSSVFLSLRGKMAANHGPMSITM